MRVLFKFVLVTVFSILTVLQAQYSELLTPFSDNIPLVVVKGDTIREYSIFGYPSSVKERKKLPVSERQKIIDEYVFNLLLQTEGDIPEVMNSEEYKKNYNELVSKNAVEHLKDLLIEENFLTEKKISAYYKENRSKYPDFKSEEGRKKVISDMKKQKDPEIKKYVSDYLGKLKKDNNVVYSDDLFKEVAAIKAKDSEEFSDSVKMIGLNKEIIKCGDQTVQLRYLYDQIRLVKPYHLQNLSDIKMLKAMSEGKILNSLLKKKAETKGLFKNKLVIQQTKDQLKYFIAGKYKEIISSDSKFIPNKEEMIDYYIAHKDDEELKSKRKMWVFEIFKFYDNSDDKKDNDKIKVAIELENIRQKIISGEEFEKYAKFYPRPHTKDGELGFIFESDHALVGKTAAKMNEGDISDLIIQEKAISIIKVTKVQESMLYKFEYVEEIIKRNLIASKRESFLENYRKELFKKYKVDVIANKEEEKK
ncbi:TPA: hypothetical protein DCR49_08735 [Candidatus Delongbacteria bacterium]|nr:MAG: hypothetical protein A2Y39_01070 [Candidatus Delongbacteria bacterium GWF2_40_14]HAQ62060.1 hypothetical protein [Candidatus Delongbacteria bacterium]